MDNILWIILGVIAVVIVWIIGVYNGLIRLKHRTDEAWSDIDVQLKRRYDLIPNLVETVKGYAKHEQGTLQKVVEARNAAMQQTGGAEEKAKAENMLSSTLKSIFALSESYPDLKANQNFAKLQDELSDTENKIQAARRFYNSNARDFNIKIDVFPNNVVAGTLKFKKYDFFEAGAGEKENISVKF
jgi:LemA protein